MCSKCNFWWNCMLKVTFDIKHFRKWPSLYVNSLTRFEMPVCVLLPAVATQFYLCEVLFNHFILQSNITHTYYMPLQYITWRHDQGNDFNAVANGILHRRLAWQTPQCWTWWHSINFTHHRMNGVVFEPKTGSRKCHVQKTSVIQHTDTCRNSPISIFSPQLMKFNCFFFCNWLVFLQIEFSFWRVNHGCQILGAF